MSSQDIRWKQRFDNFDKAFLRLSEAMELSELNELERNGLVQRFEFTLELAWKVMKDFLEEQGFEFNPSPKDTFRKAQNAHYIDYAQALIDGLDIRNALSHDYSGEKFMVSESVLRGEVFPALKSLHAFFLFQMNSRLDA
jgi:nucleotidyltransferase substrate binding protein (TIGR01987 family)